jgi:hypothetical protein
MTNQIIVRSEGAIDIVEFSNPPMKSSIYGKG